MERLPVKLDSALRNMLRGEVRDGFVMSSDVDGSVRLRGAFTRPTASDVAFTVRVHSTTGIPLAIGQVTAPQGAETFESSDLTFIGMEGYTHLSPPDARKIVERVWMRRAFVTAVRRISGPAIC